MTDFIDAIHDGEKFNAESIQRFLQIPSSFKQSIDGHFLARKILEELNKLGFSRKLLLASSNIPETSFSQYLLYNRKVNALSIERLLVASYKLALISDVLIKKESN